MLIKFGMNDPYHVLQGAGGECRLQDKLDKNAEKFSEIEYLMPDFMFW